MTYDLWLRLDFSFGQPKRSTKYRQEATSLEYIQVKKEQVFFSENKKNICIANLFPDSVGPYFFAHSSFRHVCYIISLTMDFSRQFWKELATQ